MEQKPDKRRSRVRWIAGLVLIAIIGLYIVFPASLSVAALFPGKTTVGAPPEGFEAVQMRTGDGMTLQGWYLPPTNGAVILLLHGAGGSREDVRPYARMLAGQGYGVLAMDLRGHGASGGKINRLGWQGTRDVEAAMAYLQGREGVEWIGGLGLSMGGEVLLGAASEFPAMRGIVTDGATRRCTEELLALPSERPLVRSFTARVMYAAVQALSGENPPAPLLDSMLAAETTHFLLIAGGANALEVDFNEMFAETIGGRAALWVASEAAHTAAFGLYPDEYEQRVITFFNSLR